jgi:hypothetical protein
MRLFNHIVCTAIGHEPHYFQAVTVIDGHFGLQNYARCARCSCANSRQIHTPGLLDFPAWLQRSADALRFIRIEWQWLKRTALRRSFRKRTS